MSDQKFEETVWQQIEAEERKKSEHDGDDILAEQPPIRRRPTWDRYFLEMAKVASLRSTCDRKHVGAVIAKGNWHIATGYNGSVCGLPHCDQVGHLMEDGHCVRTVHAEENAIASAAKHGIAVDGATLYSTASPCWLCFRICANAGIKRMVFLEFYRDEKIFEAARLAGIDLVDAATLP